MSAPRSNSEPGGEAGRVRCLYCGANNFPASATCWQCGRPLKATPDKQADMGSLPPPAPSLAGTPAFSTVPLAPTSSLAPKAAAVLGLMFPYIGLPVGIVFLMLDDSRKAQIGWMTIGWSVAGSVLNAIAFSALLALLGPLLKGFLPAGGGSPGGIPNGIPSIGGDGAGMLLPRLLLAHLFSVHV